MLKVQRLWDAWMADSMLAAAADGAEGAVLIAGSGHVREDRAVPWHLGGRGGGDALTLALVEVAAGSLAARDYAAFDPTLVHFRSEELRGGEGVVGKGNTRGAPD